MLLFKSCGLVFYRPSVLEKLETGVLVSAHKQWNISLHNNKIEISTPVIKHSNFFYQLNVNNVWCKETHR